MSTRSTENSMLNIPKCSHFAGYEKDFATYPMLNAIRLLQILLITNKKYSILPNLSTMLLILCIPNYSSKEIRGLRNSTVIGAKPNTILSQEQRLLPIEPNQTQVNRSSTLRWLLLWISWIPSSTLVSISMRLRRFKQLFSLQLTTTLKT